MADESTATAETTPRTTARRRLRPQPTLVWTLIAFACLRAITMLLLSLFRPADQPFLNAKGDIAWYVSIAERGYFSAVHLGESNLAFFPLTPALMKPFMLIGIPSLWAGLIVASAGSVVAAWALYRIGEHLYGQRVGCLLALTWGAVLPTSIALSLPLSESVFTACAAWACYCLLTKRLIAAAAVTILAGLARPSALALIAAVAWVCIASIIRHRDVGRAVLALCLAPLGYLAFIGFVSVEVGKPTGYLMVQRAFNSRIDFGVSWGHHIGGWLGALPTDRVDQVATGTLVALAVLAVLLFVMRIPAPLLVYTIASLLLVFVQSGHPDVIQRFLIPIFPLLIPVAVGLAKLRWWLIWPILAAATILTAKYGAELLYGTRIGIV